MALQPHWIILTHQGYIVKVSGCGKRVQEVKSGMGFLTIIGEQSSKSGQNGSVD